MSEVAGRLSALTTRGRAFLAAGVASAVCSFALGQKDLLRVAIFLAALPLVTVLVVARTRYRIAASRMIDPVRVPVGRQAIIHLTLENIGRMPTCLLLLEDHVPYVLGARPRFVLDRMSARWRREVTYAVRSDMRGKFTIGPVSLRVTDPFGLVELSRSFKTKDTLLVTPEIHPLPYARLAGEWAATGESSPRAVASDGEEDVTVREYREGDDLRRVHWRSSARRGELMVRREEQPWQSRATLLLDTRKLAHRGTGPASSFEWSVTAAASIGAHLLRRSYSVQLATDTGASVTVHTRETVAASQAENELLDALTVVEHSSTGHLDAVPALPHDGSYGLLVAIVGSIGPQEVEALVRLRQRASNAFVIVLDAPSWAPSRERSPERAAEQREQAELALRRGGWRVVTARAGEQVGQVWARAMGGGATANAAAYTAGAGTVAGAAGSGAGAGSSALAGSGVPGSGS